jgi:hypothetical protein
MLSLTHVELEVVAGYKISKWNPLHLFQELEEREDTMVS